MRKPANPSWSIVACITELFECRNAAAVSSAVEVTNIKNNYAHTHNFYTYIDVKRIILLLLFWLHYNTQQIGIQKRFMCLICPCARYTPQVFDDVWATPRRNHSVRVRTEITWFLLRAWPFDMGALERTRTYYTSGRGHIPFLLRV